MKKSVFIPLLALLFLVACNSQKKKEAVQTPETTTIEKTDSVQMVDTVSTETDSASMGTDSASMAE